MCDFCLVCQNIVYTPQLVVRQSSFQMLVAPIMPAKTLNPPPHLHTLLLDTNAFWYNFNIKLKHEQNYKKISNSFTVFVGNCVSMKRNGFVGKPKNDQKKRLKIESQIHRVEIRFARNGVLVYLYCFCWFDTAFCWWPCLCCQWRTHNWNRLECLSYYFVSFNGAFFWFIYFNDCFAQLQYVC